MQYTESIDNQGLLGIIRRACGYVDPRLMNHGYRVACLVSEMLKPHYQDDPRGLRDVCFLALLHDIGAYKTDEISRMLQFETDSVLAHSIYGYLFIQYFSPLQPLAEAVLFHHSSWEDLKDSAAISEELLFLSQVIHTADRIDVAMDVQHKTWEETEMLLKKGSGTQFSPAVVDAAVECRLQLPFKEDSEAEARFFKLFADVPLSRDEITDYLKMLIFTIDFRSRHTVTHTITTTTISSQLAAYMGMEPAACNQVVCGSMLHDLGKIGIPVEILEYPGRLSPQAMSVMRTHVDIAETIFGNEIEETVKRLALRHHEKLDGSGYPKGLCATDLSMGERIVAIADIISALAGTRSYKTAYSKEKIISIINGMKQDGLIDGAIVDCMAANFDAVMEETQKRCQPVLDTYVLVKERFDRMCRARSAAELAELAAQY